jgi:uncharacterized membrane-anchored protein YitT (DUF2179 family)
MSLIQAMKGRVNTIIYYFRCMEKAKSIKTEILNYFFIALGSFAMAFGVVAFLSPNHVATGGTAGLAIVLHNVISLPIGVLMALINIPLLALSLKYLGKKFALKTIICIGFIVLFVDALSHWMTFTCIK